LITEWTKMVTELTQMVTEYMVTGLTVIFVFLILVWLELQKRHKRHLICASFSNTIHCFYQYVCMFQFEVNMLTMLPAKIQEVNSVTML
jgi:hypothetical protein